MGLSDGVNFMWRTDIRDYPMYTKLEEKKLRKEKSDENKFIIEFIDNKFVGKPNIIELSKEEKILKYRNEFDFNNIFVNEMHFLSEYNINLVNFLCRDKSNLQIYKNMLINNKKDDRSFAYNVSFQTLMDLKNNLIDNKFVILPDEFKKNPTTESEYKNLHTYLQEIFYEPFDYKDMNYIKRAIEEGYSITDIFDAHLKYKKMRFIVLMRKLPYIIQEINSNKEKENEER